MIRKSERIAQVNRKNDIVGLIRVDEVVNRKNFCKRQKEDFLYSKPSRIVEIYADNTVAMDSTTYFNGRKIKQK
jgi:hypothetical protein